jgi:rRNA maturation endonuclease Nob1
MIEHESLDETVIVLNCSECGDTFPTGAGSDGVCPTCGGTRLDLASEPLL